MPTVRSGNIRINYETHGEGEPLLLIHGLGASTLDWEHQVPEFEKRYKVIAVDLRGHGRSEKPSRGYGIQQMAYDIADLLDALGIEKVHLLGHSLGGAVAFQYAVDQPHTLQTLTVVNSQPEFKLEGMRPYAELYMRYAVVGAVGMKGIAKISAKRNFPAPEQEQLRKLAVERGSKNDKHAYLAAMKSMINWSVVDRLARIQCPIKLINGELDFITASNNHIYSRLLPSAELSLMLGARHALPVERPEEFNQLVLNFLAQHPFEG